MGSSRFSSSSSLLAASCLVALGTLLVLPGAAAGAGEVPAAQAAPDLSPEALLPPPPPWSGKSRSLIAGQDDPWITPSERSGLTRTPSYEETMAYVRRLVEATPELALTSIGLSAQGREIWMVIADASGAETPRDLHATGKPILLAHAGIHAGEIDGKDAGLMLLRDMTVEGSRKQLLEGASFLFIPILNPDGHERSSAHGRVNQRGPVEMGWRTNSRNLNLNRDFTKLDTRELRALIATLGAWQPDLYLDLHVTDGADYQYDITFGYNGPHAHSPAIARWLDGHLRPEAEAALTRWGHVPGPLVFLPNPGDPSQGNVFWTADPRFSNGYGDLIHLPTVLVENHSLKPYGQRVLGTYLFLEASLQTLAAHGAELEKAVAADRARRPRQVPLAWTVGPPAARPDSEAGTTAAPPATFKFLGVETETAPSKISGGTRLRWTGKPVTMTIPALRMQQPAAVASRPVAYWIPAGWDRVIERLAAHGVEMERLTEPRSLEVEMLRLTGAEINPMPFEGRVLATATPVAEKHQETFPAGSVRVPTDQPLGDLAVLLLEPASPDSFFQWGFFLSVLQRTEYAEAYALEPMAEAMLAADPELAKAFAKALEDDPELAGDVAARLQWFYQRSPYWDQRWQLYPVGRELERR